MSHNDESRCTWEEAWLTIKSRSAHGNEACHIKKSHSARWNKSCYIVTSHATHTDDAYHIRMSHSTRRNESCHIPRHNVPAVCRKSHTLYSLIDIATWSHGTHVRMHHGTHRIEAYHERMSQSVYRNESRHILRAATSQ